LICATLLFYLFLAHRVVLAFVRAAAEAFRIQAVDHVHNAVWRSTGPAAAGPALIGDCRFDGLMI